MFASVSNRIKEKNGVPVRRQYSKKAVSNLAVGILAVSILAVCNLAECYLAVFLYKSKVINHNIKVNVFRDFFYACKEAVSIYIYFIIIIDNFGFI